MPLDLPACRLGHVDHPLLRGRRDASRVNDDSAFRRGTGGTTMKVDEVAITAAMGRIAAWNRQLTARALDGLAAIPGITIYGPPDPPCPQTTAVLPTVVLSVTFSSVSQAPEAGSVPTSAESRAVPLGGQTIANRHIVP
jgi:hypothetical protein